MKLMKLAGKEKTEKAQVELKKSKAIPSIAKPQELKPKEQEKEEEMNKEKK